MRSWRDSQCGNRRRIGSRRSQNKAAGVACRQNQHESRRHLRLCLVQSRVTDRRSLRSEFFSNHSTHTGRFWLGNDAGSPGCPTDYAGAAGAMAASIHPPRPASRSQFDQSQWWRRSIQERFGAFSCQCRHRAETIVSWVRRVQGWQAVAAGNASSSRAA